MDIVKNVYGTTAEWAANDIVLNKGELGIEKTAKGEHKIKVGDGTSAWSALPYSGSTPTEMAGKADKVSGATAEHLAALDANGNLKDSGESVVSLKEYVAKAITDLPNIRHYGARWNKTQAQMTRMYDAASFPTTITNFAHRGSVNANYSNPFDSIYPWAGIKLCNISIDLYRNLAAGDSITKCVTAWEGDVDFSYNDANGVWRYRPEFWGKSWEDDTYRYFDVSEKAIGSYVHYPEAIVGRWHGRKENRTIGGEEKGCLIPSVGMPAKSISMSGLHTRAKNFGATLDSIYSVDADTLLCVVEFATMNTQNAIGNGVSNLYRQSSDLIQEDATNSTTVKVLAAAGSAYCIPGAIFDIGTSNGGTQVGSFVVVSATPNVGDAQYLDVTLDQAVTVTGANYWSVHGLVNVADEAIGSKSGYIGENGKCNAYYRGIVMFGNMWLYILGAYENKDDHHIWIANSDEEADNHDALDTTVHYDTGLVLPTAGGYTKKLGLLSRSGLLSIPAFCVETGGDSSNPVGDYFYNGVYTYNTVLLRGGSASNGSNDGAFYGYWSYAASSGYWNFSARPRLKNP
nr:MAG TPA: tail collar fiber protein [Caudoviricetes sp.]